MPPLPERIYQKSSNFNPEKLSISFSRNSSRFFQIAALLLHGLSFFLPVHTPMAFTKCIMQVMIRCFGALSQLLPESILFRCQFSASAHQRFMQKYLPHQFGVFCCQSCCHCTTGTAASYKHTRALVCFSIALTCATFINLIFFSLARGCTTSVTLQSCFYRALPVFSLPFLLQPNDLCRIFRMRPDRKIVLPSAAMLRLYPRRS